MIFCSIFGKRKKKKDKLADRSLLALTKASFVLIAGIIRVSWFGLVKLAGESGNTWLLCLSDSDELH